MASAFEIRILRTYQTCPEPIRDTCLAGALRVTINGVVVADADEYAVAVSARSLLRTIDLDHSASNPVSPTRMLLSHDCGFPDYACDAFGTNWTVTHDHGLVHLSDVEGFDSHPVVRHLRFADADTVIPLAEYRSEVVRFARDAKAAYFVNGDRQIAHPHDRQEYEQFWREYDDLLRRHASA